MADVPLLLQLLYFNAAGVPARETVASIASDPLSLSVQGVLFVLWFTMARCGVTLQVLSTTCTRALYTAITCMRINGLLLVLSRPGGTVRDLACTLCVIITHRNQAPRSSIVPQGTKSCTDLKGRGSYCNYAVVNGVNGATKTLKQGALARVCKCNMLAMVCHTQPCLHEPLCHAILASLTYWCPRSAGEAQRWRLVNANEVLHFELAVDGCDMHWIAADGIYFDAPRKQTAVLLTPGSRADVILQCNTAGQYKFESKQHSTTALKSDVNNLIDIAFLTLDVVASNETPMTIPTTLPGRPLYLRSLLDDTVSTSYDVEMQMNFDKLRPGEGTLNKVPMAGESDCRLGMKVNEVQQWTINNKDSGRTHPYHMHVNHMQIVGYTGEVSSMHAVDVAFARVAPLKASDLVQVNSFPPQI